MKKSIIDIRPALEESAERKRVAAYCRVSSGKDTMLHSLAAQIDYYRKMICCNPNWRFAGVYADEAKTGTKDNREQFQLLLKECRNKNIDMIITKSISRFARNTVTVLQTVRELSSLGIDVFFEEQNINTMSAEGEVMLTLLASFAQAESLSVSDNCKWRIRKGFEEGRASTCTMLGYRLVDGDIILVPSEAEIVRKIFRLYLDGYGFQKICNILNEEGIATRNGCIWHPESIRTILTNEKYMGDLRLQLTYTTDHLTKKQLPNNGEYPQYYVEDDHEPIIDKELFQHVQALIKKRQEKHTMPHGTTSVFTGKIRCADCGKNYHRKTTACRVVWCCATFNSRGKKYCPTSKYLPEETLKHASAQVLGIKHFDESAFEASVNFVEVHPRNLLRFVLKNGTSAEYIWQDRSRRESWTAEMKNSARQQYYERKGQRGK